MTEPGIPAWEKTCPPYISAFCCAAGGVKRDATARGGSGRASGPDPGAKGTMCMVRDPPGSGEKWIIGTVGATTSILQGRGKRVGPFPGARGLAVGPAHRVVLQVRGLPVGPARHAVSPSHGARGGCRGPSRGKAGIARNRLSYAVISTNVVRRNLAFRLNGGERFLAALEMTEGGRNDRTGYSRLGEDMPPCIQAFCCAAGRVKRDASVRGGSGRASGPDPGAKGTMFMVRDPPGSGETDHRYGWSHYRHRASSRVGGNGRGRFPGHGALLSGPRIVSSSRYGALRSGPRAMPFPRVMGQGGDAVDPAEEKPASRATGRHTLSFRRTQ